MINPWRKQSKVNPQRESGHREIENKVFQAFIAAKLPGAVYQIVLTVIDRTWGFGKPAAPISLSYFQETTGLSRQSVGIALQKAESMHLIVIERHGTNPKNPNHYMFNKHYDTWSTRQLNHTSKENELVNQITPDWSTKSPQSRQPLMPSSTMPKENYKETIKENNDHFGTEMVALSSELKEIISYYFKVYREHTGEPHPNLKPEQWQRVVAEMEAFSDEFGVPDSQDFQTMIDYHFQRKLKTDHNISHFATEGILENLYYKKLYYE